MPEDLTTGTDNGATTAPVNEAPTSSAPAGSALASLEKVASAAPSAADPSATPIVSNATPAGTTVQPGQPGANAGVQGDAAKAGEDAAWSAIPEERRNVILENTRKKASEAATAEVMSKLGWAKDLEPETVQNAFSLAGRMAQNPVDFVIQLISEIRQVPELAAVFERKFGTAGVGGNAPTGAVKGKMPTPRLKAEDGTLAYSSDQVHEIVNNLKAEFEEMVGGRVQPLEDFRGSLEERETVMRTIHESRTESNTLLTELRSLDHWPKPDATGKNPGEAKIAGYLAAIPAETKKKIGSVASMYQAYNTYLQKDVFPTLGSKTEQEVRDNLRRKAAAGTGTASPGATPSSTTAKKPTNTRELADHMAKMAAVAST